MSQSSDTIRNRIAALQAELKAAEKEERELRAKAIKAFVPQYRFTLEPGKDSWKEIWDETIKPYYLKGEMLNSVEYKAIGGSPFEGGMTYLYNTLTNKIVGPTGGGSLFIGSFYDRHKSPETIVKFQALADFIRDNPNGGDVTAIVDYQKK